MNVILVYFIPFHSTLYQQFKHTDSLEKEIDELICGLIRQALSGKEVTGALTYSFIQTVQNEPGLTYGHLLSTMRSTIHGTKTGIVALNGPIASFLNKLLGLRIKQVFYYEFRIINILL